MSRPSNHPPTVLVDKSIIFFLPSLYIVIHTLEELPGFAAWVDVHFGTHPTDMFALQHIFIWLLVFLISYKAYQKKRASKWVIMATAAQIQFALNALFHITTFVLFQEYSPGVISASAIGIPATIWFLRTIHRSGAVTSKDFAWAALWGTLIAIAAVSFLFLPF